MRFLRVSVWVVLSLFLVNTLVFSKGKKPPETLDEDESDSICAEFLERGEDCPELAAPGPEKIVPDLGYEPLEEVQVVEEEPVEELPVEVEPPEVEQVVHSVWIWQESRDSLWKIAKKYYGDPWKWKEIYLANRNTILDPYMIFPKQKILIPPAEE